MRYLLILLSFILPASVLSQVVISGTVIDAETNKPLAGASIFLPNTSNGTVAAADGKYRLDIPAGKYDVVFSAIGYETKLISSLLPDSFHVVKLQPKVRELDNVEVGYDKDGWSNWGQFFLDNFIGTTAFSQRCTISNTGSLRFRHNKKADVLTVYSNEPLVIINNALGYKIKYQLEDFVYKFHDRRLYFQGYPLFEEMSGNERKMRRWRSNRLAAYEGSQLHFMRSLYRNRIAENGFEVHHLKKIENTAKDSVRKLVRAGDTYISPERGKILRQPDAFDVMSSIKLTGDSIAFAIDSLTAGLQFNDYLYILYLPKKAPSEYQRTYPDAGNRMASQVTLLGSLVLEVRSNGNFFPPSALLSLGYWAWSEKIANLLPINYRP